MLHIADVFAGMFPEHAFKKHTNLEGDFSHLKDDEVIVEVLSENGSGENLFLFNHKATLTLVYANWSCHYPRDEEGAEHMMQVAATIFNGSSHIEKIEWKDRSIVILMYKNRILFSDDAAHEWRRFLSDSAFLRAIADKKADISKIYWNSAS